ncbi:MAG: serine protease [Acholeplasmatales bacterium]|jgi:serine protease Do|nr:serine protease [Acholeplasmatales bacterium]
MKKIHIINITLNIITFLGISSLIFFNKFYSADSIFDRSIHSVFEVKCETEGDISYGSAVAFEKDLLVTNFHVISYNTTTTRKIHDFIMLRSPFSNDYFECTVKTYDENNDIAILEKMSSVKLEIKTIKTAKKNSKPGEKCFAIGNANNLGIGITEGNIVNNSVSIKINDFSRKMIQANVTSSNGSSGGALLNKKGELIGITTLKLVDSYGLL